MSGEINPIDPPTKNLVHEFSNLAKNGPWADGKYVVIHLHEQNLPRYCVKTGTKENLIFHIYRKSFTSSDGEYADFELYIEIPVNRYYIRRYYIQSILMAMAMIATGPALLFVPLLTGISFPLPALLVPYILMGAGIAFGTRWLSAPPLRPVATYLPYFWLTGAAPEFLANLPPLPEWLPSRGNRWFRWFE